MGHTAAVFDFDRTLIATESQREEALFILRHHCPGPLYPFRLLRVVAAEPFYKRNRISDDRYIRTYLTSYKGIPIDRLKAHAEGLYRTRIAPLLFPEMVALMAAHREKGHLIIILSATSSHLIAPFLQEHPAHAWAATEIATNENGICTGKPSGPVCVGVEKARALRRLARSMEIDLEASHAYSDHHADLEFLEAVGHPTVVNPTRKLGQIALERGWKAMEVGSAGTKKTDAV